MKRRAEIALSEDELRAYITSAPTAVLCTNGPGGYPHAVAMWFIGEPDGSIWMTTYRKSQKAVNIRRNAKVALHIESGTTYETLKGVLMRGDAALVDDPARVLEIFGRIQQKMTGAFPDGVEDVLRHQAQKRVAIRFVPQRFSSWDHAKLGGSY